MWWLVCGVVIGVIVGAILYLVWQYRQIDFLEPKLSLRPEQYAPTKLQDEQRSCGPNSLHRNRWGVWEARLEGSAEERGAAFGAMAADLLVRQEQIFVDQIRSLIPSDRYLHFLYRCTIFFNRRMAGHVPEEYRREIAAMARFCSPKFAEFGSSYVRQLNYHAAHDIGHAMQKYMLVGCSAFAVRGTRSVDGQLLVGRNFDFYFGDAFAREKLLLVVKPERGYAFASVAWPGMWGVVSGMNQRGLTVTLNAAEGKIPTSAALPVSLLAREILQYAATLDEAFAIVERAKIFVSESLLVASAADDRAEVFEKTPGGLARYRSDEDRLCVTNHFQSADFASDAHNQQNIATSDSLYRHRRLCELIDQASPINEQTAATILRDRGGLGGVDIGLTNEKAINQSLAHHTVIFRPSELRMWVSTAPWQAGEMICYDLHEIFEQAPKEGSWADPARTIAADAIYLEQDYPRIKAYRAAANRLREAIRKRRALTEFDPEQFQQLNPAYYETYELLGDYYHAMGHADLASPMWQAALECEIPKLPQRTALLKKLKRYDKR